MSSLCYWLTKFINLNGCIYHIWPSLVVVILQTEQKTVIRNGIVNKKGVCSLLQSLYCVNQASQLSFSFCNMWWHAKLQKNLLSYEVATSRYLLSCKKKPLNVPSCQLNAKNNGLVLLFNTIFILVNSDLKIWERRRQRKRRWKSEFAFFQPSSRWTTPAKSLTLSNVREPSHRWIAQNHIQV